MNTPVALLIYNRPDLTAQVFARIAEAKPQKLLIVADGPRIDEDAETCRLARAAATAIDWPCEVQRNYADVNLGCRRRVSSGLDWVFSQFEEAIILEDDCLPDPSFFPFCEELLFRYRDDERVGHIGGSDQRLLRQSLPASYYFSRYPSIWGWATWRRAWRHYDVRVDAWSKVRAQRQHLEWFGTHAEARHFECVWNDIHAGEIDTWDGQWLFALRRRGALCVAPNGNLVTNIGFDARATHTKDARHPFASLAAQAMAFPLKHPRNPVCNDRADRARASAEFLRGRRWWNRTRRTLANKHCYGALLRRLPLLGPLWARWRRGKAG